jgi:hypothetical protein
MEIAGIVGNLGKALWDLKVMYDDHKKNKAKVKELDNFIQDLKQSNLALEK